MVINSKNSSDGFVGKSARAIDTALGESA